MLLYWWYFRWSCFIDHLLNPTPGECLLKPTPLSSVFTQERLWRRKKRSHSLRMWSLDLLVLHSQFWVTSYICSTWMLFWQNKSWCFERPQWRAISWFHAGDILGRALKNIDGLLKMPYGCGEQNMALLAPNIYILHYLKNTQQMTPDILKKATNFLTGGESGIRTFQPLSSRLTVPRVLFALFNELICTENSSFSSW